MKTTWKLSSKYNFDKIGIGESVRILAAASRVQAAAVMYGKRNGMKFSTAKDGNHVVVWRIY